MSTKLFVGGLAWATRDDSLRDHFAQCGDVTDAKVIMERETGRSRGFGFVTFADAETAAKAREVEQLRARRPSDSRRHGDRATEPWGRWRRLPPRLVSPSQLRDISCFPGEATTSLCVIRTLLDNS